MDCFIFVTLRAGYNPFHLLEANENMQNLKTENKQQRGNTEKEELFLGKE